MSDKTQTHFGNKEDYHAITAIGISSKLSQNRFIAVAQKAYKHGSDSRIEYPKINVYDAHYLRVRRNIALPEDFKETITEYMYLAFPGDSEQKLISLSTPNPHPIMCVWAIDKNPARLLFYATVCFSQPALEVAFNVTDSTYLSAIGKKTFKYYKIDDNLRVKHQNFNGPPNLSQEFSCHAWLESKGMVLCTDEGNIYYHDENADFKYEIKHNMGAWQICCVKSYSKGFVVGGDNLTINVFNHTDNSGQLVFE